ncbi:uncharacterized protein TNCV_3459481 [Trichonephila clavipes]|nr:uncharacterized protein TNCV_3459481 [Trichonephila clavipes]
MKLETCCQVGSRMEYYMNAKLIDIHLAMGSLFALDEQFSECTPDVSQEANSQARAHTHLQQRLSHSGSFIGDTQERERRVKTTNNEAGSGTEPCQYQYAGWTIKRTKTRFYGSNGKVALQVEEDKASKVQASTSVRRVTEALNLPSSMVQKIMRNILRYYPYKLQLVQELLPHDFETRHLFSLQFLARLEDDPEWPWNILWTDEAHFPVDGSANTHSCRIWETDNPHSTLQVPLYSPKVTVWCGFSASFILGPYFVEELGAGGPVTCSITGQRYASLLRNKIIPYLQAHQCLSHITLCKRELLHTLHVVLRTFSNITSQRNA